MALVFPNVSILGLSQESRFFDAGFHYASYKRISIEGLVINLTQFEGITGIWSGQNGLLNTVYNNKDYQELILNNISFGSGRIENINFSAGQDVRTKTFNANLLIYDSGNLFNLTGFYYSGIDISHFQYLDNFSEDYSFNKKQNGGYDYSHSMNVKFISGGGVINPIQAAQNLVKTIFTGSNLGLNFYSGFTNKQGKRFIKESYNLVDNTCLFSETFDFDNNLGNYSATQVNSINFDEQGVITVVENGTIRGIENPNYQKAIAALNSQITGAYLRCSGVQAFYVPSGIMLNSYPILQGRTLDIYSNNLSYVIGFNNHPSNSGTYFWNYTQQVTLENGIANVSEVGTVLGKGENRDLAYASAKTGFANIKLGIGGRILNTFSSNFYAPPQFLLDKKESYSPYNSNISYSYTYSNNPNLISNSGVRWMQVNQLDNYAIYKLNHLDIMNYKEIIQDDKQSIPGITSISINLQGDKTVGLSQFLSNAVTQFNTRAPIGSERYVADCSYNYSPNENTANVSLTWKYNRFYGRTVFPV